MQEREVQAERDRQRLAAEQQAREAAEQKQQAAEAAKSSLSEMGAEFYDAAGLGNWASDKNAFSTTGVIESWLERLEEAPDPDVMAQLKVLLDTHYKGLLENPDKVKGKKKKPVYKDRMRQVAQRFNRL